MPRVSFEHARRICRCRWWEPWRKVPESCDPSFPPTDNLWSVYTDKGVFVEKPGTPSVAVPEESRSSKLPYVLTDIMTYFTMLVGIYFPSVTGEAAGTPAGQAGSSLSPNVASLAPSPAPFSFLFGSRKELQSAPRLFQVGSAGSFVPRSPERPVLSEVTL